MQGPEWLSYTPKVKEHLRSYVDSIKPDLSRVHPIGPQTVELLYEYASRGKCIRANFVVQSYLWFKRKPTKEVYDAAAAIELLQSAFLIHDDIIDDDERRRGKPSMHVHMRNIAKKYGAVDNVAMGEGLAICMGDIGFFMLFDLVNKLNISATKKQKMLDVIVRVCLRAGTAEMMDVLSSGKKYSTSQKSLYNLHHFKTAEYTFCLPMMLGGILGGASDKVLKRIFTIGLSLGLIFQLRDDQLGMFGVERIIGKPVGSDVREGKGTLYKIYLEQKATKAQKSKLAKIFGNHKATKKDIAYVQQLIVEYGIDALVEKEIEHQSALCKKEIENKDLNRHIRGTLLDINAYLTKRKC